jgi:type I restriction enzyme R subunit
VAHGPDIAPQAAGAERTNYSEVILEHRLRDALDRVNPDLPVETLDDAFRRTAQQCGTRYECDKC